MGLRAKKVRPRQAWGYVAGSDSGGEAVLSWKRINGMTRLLA